MQHWNGDQMCAIDIETTGTDPSRHEMIQLAILALDANCLPRKDVVPFYIDIAPESPETADVEAMKVNKLKLAQIAIRGHDREKAVDLLEDWIGKLGIPCNKYGRPKRIYPLGHNYSAFDLNFMKKWLGEDRYDQYFDPRIRDTLSICNFLNDHAAMKGEVVPFFKTNLTWVCKQLNITRERSHDALQDCLATAMVYNLLMRRGMLV